MSANINIKKKNVSAEFLRKTAGYITGATGEYFQSVMPITTSTIVGAKQSLQELNSTFSDSAASVIPKIRQIQTQANFRSISNWFLQKGNDFDSDGDFDSQLEFDVDVDVSSDGDFAKAQISEWGKNANKISKTVVETSHKVVDAQISATANIMSTLDRQTAIVSSGFNQTNSTLNKILEVLTKNTSTMIEMQVASTSGSKDSLDGGKFDIGDYKKSVQSNFKNSELGTMVGMLPMFMDMAKGNINPQTLVKMGLGAAINKSSPNLKKNMESLDNAIGEVIMGSLIRLGENKSNRGPMGMLAKLFGIDGGRKNVDPTKSTLELKSVPYDSVSKEALTQAIPGYLRQILVALGGPDQTYDYKSRMFRSKGSAKKEFGTLATNTRTLSQASRSTKNAMGNSDFSNMLYDLMMSDLGSGSTTTSARKKVDRLGNQKQAENYIINTVLGGIQLSGQELSSAKQIARRLSSTNGVNSHEILNQAVKLRKDAEKRLERYVNEQHAYGNDISGIVDNAVYDKRTIASNYGKNVSAGGSLKNPSPSERLQGLNYTNTALYEIWRRLNEGINVYQVGSSSSQTTPFSKMTNEHLNVPLHHKPRNIKSVSLSTGGVRGGGINIDDSPNYLDSQEDDPEGMTRGERFKRWGKYRGGNLSKAMFSGNPEEVKDAFVNMFGDIGKTGGRFIKDKAAQFNQKSGNITAYLKHKITGSGYSYTGDDGKDVVISKNDKGGMLGYIDELVFGDGGAKALAKRMASSTSSWFKSVAGYFDYSGKDKEEQSVAGKRKHILGTSVGALAGMGILGGPLGVIMGGLAGSALSQTDGIGAKLKTLLFGGMKFDEKGNPIEKKRGLVQRALDGIVDPIKYQIGKTVTAFSGILKKNILGPLSNIGEAIKERMSNAAGGVVSKVFGTIFKGAGSLLKKIILAPLNIAGAATGLVGNVVRGGARVTGGGIGSGLNTLAKLVAGKSGRDNINERIEGQKSDADADQENSSYYQKGGYKSWKKSENIRRSKMDIKDYLNEKVAESTDEIAGSTSTIAGETKDLGKFIQEGLFGRSIHTQDEHVSSRLNTIIQLLGGNIDSTDKFGTSLTRALSPKKNSDKSDNDTFHSSILTGATTLSAMNADVSDEEFRLTAEITDKAASGTSNRQTLVSKFKSLLSLNKKSKKEEKGEKKDPWWKSLLNGFLGNWKSIGLAAGGMLALFNEDFRNFIGDTVRLLGPSLKNLANWIIGGDKSGAKNPIFNAVTSPLDIKTDSPVNYILPGASLDHVRTDATGANIKNIGATRAKDKLVTAPLHLGVMKNLRMNAAYAGSDLAAANSAAALGSGDIKSATSYGKRSDRLADTALRLDDGVSAGSAFANSMIGSASSLGVGVAAGKVANYGTTSILKKIGVDDQWAETGGRVAGVAGTVIGTKGAASGKGVFGWVKNKIVWILGKLIEGLKKNKTFAKVVGTIDSQLGKIGSMITEKVLEPLIGKITSILAKMGIETTAAGVTLGLSVAVSAGVGAIVGGCNTENLFGVLPGEADTKMKTIATTLGALFGLPYVSLIEIVDIIIIPVMGKGLRQLLAELMYVGISLDQEDAQARLDAKTENFSAELQGYNDRFGTDLQRNDFNDMINRNLGSKMWRGGTSMTEDGHVQFDEAGATVTKGGIKGVFVGKQEYAKDSEGNVLRTADNKPIMAVDQYGNKIFEKKKFGNHVGSFFKSTGEFFGGKKTYETDEEGNVLYDDKGAPIEKDKGPNILSRVGSSIKAGTTKVGEFFGGVGDGIKSGASKIGGFFSSVKEDGGKFIGDAFSNMKSWITTGNKTELSIKSDDPLGGFKKSLGGVTDLIGYPIKGIVDIGKSVSGFFKNIASKASGIYSDDEASISKVKTGDMTIFNKEYWSSGEDDPENPIGTLGNVFSFVNKLVSAPGAMIGYIGSNAVKGFKKMTSGMSDIVKKGSTLVDKAKAGQMSIFSTEFWAAPETSDDSPLGGLAVASTYFSRIMSLPSLLVSEGFNFVKNGLSDIGSGIKNWWSDLWGKATGEGSAITATGGAGVGGRGGLGVTSSEMNATSLPVANIGATASIGSGFREGGNPLSKSFRLTSGMDRFGHKSTLGNYASHTGIDLQSSDGNQANVAVRSMFPGTVEHTQISDTGYGNMVAYRTPAGVLIRNAHLSHISSGIQKGTIVKPGDQLGIMGSTGNSTGPHLHYEMRDPVTNEALDPYPTLSGAHIPTNSNSSMYTNNTSFNAGSNMAEGASIPSEKGPLATFVDRIKEFGSSLLHKITGGLLGGVSTTGNINTDSNTGSTISEKQYGGYSTSGNPASDPNADKILFSKLEGLDTDYADWSGQTRKWSYDYQRPFILAIAPMIQATMDCGVLASVRIAQAIEESGWGRFNGNSLFGVMKNSGGLMKYSSWDDAIYKQAYGVFKGTGYYNKALNIKDWKLQLKTIAECGYCTEPPPPIYADKVGKHITSYDLSYFDHPKKKTNHVSPVSTELPTDTSSSYIGPINQPNITSGNIGMPGIISPNQQFGTYANGSYVPNLGRSNNLNSSMPPGDININSIRQPLSNYGVGGGSDNTKGSSKYSYRGIGGIGNIENLSESFGTNITRGSNLSDRELMQQLLFELRTISGNTGKSNVYLDSISQKEFGVDSELRGAFDSMKGASKKPTSPISHNGGNIRMVNQMIKP